MDLLIYILLFAALQNIDNFALATAYSWQSIQIQWRCNVLIAALSALFTGVAVFAATVLKMEISYTGWDRYSETVGRGLLVMIGTWTLVGYFRTRFFPQLSGGFQEGRVNQRMAMTTREALIAGTALAIDNVGPSFAFGLLDTATVATGSLLTTLTFILSLISVALGAFAGARGRLCLQHLSPKLVAGFLLLTMALIDPGDIARAALLPSKLKPSLPALNLYQHQKANHVAH